MKNMTAKIGALIALTSTYSFAIFGVGVHWAPNFNSEFKGESENIRTIIANDPISGAPVDTISADLIRSDALDLTGFGFKFWIDALPVIDIEGTVNLQAATYTAKINYDLLLDDKGEIPLSLEVPGSSLLPEGEEINPAFGWAMIDLSVTYPIELVSIPVLFDWNIYAGGGITYVYGTPVVDKAFAETIVTGILEEAVEAIESGDTSSEPPSAQEIATAVADAFENVDAHQGVGGHAIFGTRIGLPVVSIYANGKYYFGGLPDGATSGLTLELGLGFGI
jgi:hypothetical protein